MPDTVRLQSQTVPLVPGDQSSLGSNWTAAVFYVVDDSCDASVRRSSVASFRSSRDWFSGFSISEAMRSITYLGSLILSVGFGIR